MKYFEFISNRAAVVNKAVPASLCEETVGLIEKESVFKPCQYNSDINIQYRDSSEVKIEDKKLTHKFWEHIKEYIPSVCEGEKLVGPHYSRVYLLRYFEGQFFKKHYDGYSQDSKGNVSKLTVMIYLNDMDESLGGATRFYSEPGRNIRFSHPYQDYPVFDVLPRIGSMVMFTHQLLHEGVPILKGYKYCIRFNILYTNSNTKKSLAVSRVKENRLKVSSIPYPNQSKYQRTSETDTDIPEFRVKENRLKVSSIPYPNPTKYRRTSETDTSVQKFQDIPKFKSPNSNGLKYKQTKMLLHDGMEVTLSSDLDKVSRNRWLDVSMRPHVFIVRRSDFPGFVDNTIGRPPTWEEDFCPNCYEILPLRNTYTNCSGCCYPVVEIDESRRRFNLAIHKNGCRIPSMESKKNW